MTHLSHFCYILIHIHMLIHTYTYICWIHTDTMINDALRKTQEWRTQEGRHKKTSLEKYIPLTLFVRFACERCWRPNINIIFWPHCYDRHVVSCSPDVGVHSIRAFRGPPLVSTLWESAGNCPGTQTQLS